MPLQVPTCDDCGKLDAKFTCPTCGENYCQTCDPKQHSSKQGQLHQRYPYLGIAKPSRYCLLENHYMAPLTAFCQSCKKTACSNCILTDHKTHNCTPVQTEVENVKENLNQSVTSLKKTIEIAQKEIKELETELEKKRNTLLEMEQGVAERNKLIGSNYEGYLFLEIVSQLFKVETGYPSVMLRYRPNPIKSWGLTKTTSMGCTSDGERLFITDCDTSKSCINTYTLDGKQLEYKFPPLIRAGDIDIDEKGIYIIDKQYVYILNRKLEFISSFSPSPASCDSHNHLKVDQNKFFLTLEGQTGSIFIYTKEGKLIKQLGSQGSGPTQFDYPKGISVDEKNLYICDQDNCRIQVISKIEPYTFVRRWGTNGTEAGQFHSPYCICVSEGVVYVSDDYSVQLFTCEGGFLQRLGGKEMSKDAGKFSDPRGICVVKNMLYVSEYTGKRIQVFQRV